MNNISYSKFTSVDPDEMLKVLNEDSLRSHLIEHDYFTPESVRAWMGSKVEVGDTPGCRIRAVYVDAHLAGWCGIQPDDNGFEIAIVLSNRFWGSGIAVFKTMMCWAEELGHKEVLFHLLDSRRDYKSLATLANRVCKTQLMGRSFTTYYLTVGGATAISST
ncbi:GNAT family N-acetyltransferase [Marinobacterium lacunae]|uniref:GNAT family N-acetyltransferase n=1 Tax=Marinobacterium lacunae TaxID=1232683 RepID=UPI0005686F26|nr:hypothetical protein [Marinobacterium lacunae]